MSNVYKITTSTWNIKNVWDVINTNQKIEISDECIDKVNACRKFLDDKIADGTQVIYGINTGFGSLCNTVVSPSELSKLQKNLIISHACGVGDLVPTEIVKTMLLLKIKALCYGHSGISLGVVNRLTYFFNNNIIPLVYQQGSLGASGDLAPLAHMCLPLLGLGKVLDNGVEKPAAEILAKHNLQPIVLQSKEGLALLNGTQFMSSYATYILNNAHNILSNSMLIAAMGIEGYNGRIEPFLPQVHAIRNHKGQQWVAAEIRNNLEGSEIVKNHKEQVQDPYSFRCIPQVYGASYDAINNVTDIVNNEINAVTDNPTIFPDDDLVVSAGNFHGQPMAINLDYLAIALAEIGSIAERRIYKLINGINGLPPYLSPNPGINSGFMIAQYTAASVVSQSKQYCTPASVDTIDSSNGQEDHVSMGANAATKCYLVLENLYKVLGIELMTSAQALEFRRPLKSSEKIENLHSEYRKQVAFVNDDIEMQPEIQKSIDFVKTMN